MQPNLGGETILLLKISTWRKSKISQNNFDFDKKIVIGDCTL